VVLMLIFGVVVVHASPPLVSRSRLAGFRTESETEAGSRRVYRKMRSLITPGNSRPFFERREGSSLPLSARYVLALIHEFHVGITSYCVGFQNLSRSQNDESDPLGRPRSDLLCG
jgi:hypothetical protein